MKRLKEIDVTIQILLIAGSFIYGVVIADYRFILGYFVVGGWQLLSCLLHAVSPYPYLPSPARRSYLLTLLWTFGLGVLSLAVNSFSHGFILLFLFALLFVSPFYAIWYTYICAEETGRMRQRELIQLR